MRLLILGVLVAVCAFSLKCPLQFEVLLEHLDFQQQSKEGTLRNSLLGYVKLFFVCPLH